MNNKIVMHTAYRDGTTFDQTSILYREDARRLLAGWVRQLRRDPNVVVSREARGRFFATAVNGAWEGTRELVEEVQS